MGKSGSTRRAQGIKWVFVPLLAFKRVLPKVASPFLNFVSLRKAPNPPSLPPLSSYKSSHLSFLTVKDSAVVTTFPSFCHFSFLGNSAPVCLHRQAAGRIAIRSLGVRPVARLAAPRPEAAPPLALPKPAMRRRRELPQHPVRPERRSWHPAPCSTSPLPRMALGRMRTVPRRRCAR